MKASSNFSTSSLILLLSTHHAFARPANDITSVALSNIDLSGSNENVLGQSTLHGWKHCTQIDRSTILEAVRDSTEILSTMATSNFASWRQLPTVIEFFGEAVANDYHGWSNLVQQNFRNAQNFTAGTSDVNNQVFCHDESMDGPLKNECSSHRQPAPIVVSRNYLGQGESALML